jgi:hypothetical protein
MNHTHEVKEMLSDVERVLTATSKAVSAMSDGARMSLKNLTNQVATELGREPSKVVGLVTLFAHNTKLAHVSRGAEGGVIRGQKVTKPVKVSKKSVVTDTTDSDNAAE